MNNKNKKAKKEEKKKMINKVIKLSEKTKKALNKGVKIAVLSATLATTFSTTAFAADTLKIYSGKSVEGNATSGYYAYGYVKCEPYHYARVRLIENATDKIVKDSGRKYGFDKVEAKTGKTTNYTSKSKLNARVYYGWQ